MLNDRERRNLGILLPVSQALLFAGPVWHAPVGRIAPPRLAPGTPGIKATEKVAARRDQQTQGSPRSGPAQPEPDRGMPHWARKEQGHKPSRQARNQPAKKNRRDAPAFSLVKLSRGSWLRRPSLPDSRSFPDTSGARCGSRCNRHAPTRHRSARGHRRWSGAWRRCWY